MRATRVGYTSGARYMGSSPFGWSRQTRDLGAAYSRKQVRCLSIHAQPAKHGEGICLPRCDPSRIREDQANMALADQLHFGCSSSRNEVDRQEPYWLDLRESETDHIGGDRCLLHVSQVAHEC